MKTKEERESEFRKDLAELLEMHNAEMDMTYGEHGGGHGEMTISMNEEYDAEGNISKPYFEFMLG